MPIGHLDIRDDNIAHEKRTYQPEKKKCCGYVQRGLFVRHTPIAITYVIQDPTSLGFGKRCQQGLFAEVTGGKVNRGAARIPCVFYAPKTYIVVGWSELVCSFQLG